MLIDCLAVVNGFLTVHDVYKRTREGLIKVVYVAETNACDIFKKRYPGHSPTWTSVVVKALANEGVHVEVQAEAAVYT